MWFTARSGLVWVAVGASLAGGCGADTAGAGRPGLDDPAGRALVFALAEEETVAGVPVGYHAELREADGRPVAARFALELVADGAPLLDRGDAIVITRAGGYRIRARARLGGRSYEAEDRLRVRPDAPVALDVETARPETVAGEPLPYSVELLDRYGNAIDPEAAGVALHVEPAGPVLAGDGTVSSTVTGRFALVGRLAAAQALVDSAPFAVLPAAPAAIELDLALPVEVGVPAPYTVRVRDRFGNLTADGYLVEVDPPDGALAGGGALTFAAEGWYTVCARVAAATEIAECVGPFPVDSSGPELRVDTPARAAMLTETTVAVAGVVADAVTGVASLTVNGVDVAIGADGGFATTVEATFGLHLLELIALDGDGNRTLVRQSFLRAPAYAPAASLVDGGMVARLNQQALDTLAAYIADQITPDRLGAPTGRIFGDSSRSCFDPCFGLFGGCETCVTWYSLDFYVDGVSFSDVTLALDPGPGHVWGTAVIYGVRVPWHADGHVVGIGYSAGGDVTADTLTVAARMVPWVDGDGVVHVDVTDVIVTAGNFDFDMHGWGWLEDVLGFFGFDVDGTVRGLVENALRRQVAATLPRVVRDALQDLDLSAELDVEGATFALEAFLSAILADDAGLTLAMETELTGPVDDAIDPKLGSMLGTWGLPAYAPEPGVQVSLGVDFANQLLYALWLSGLMHRTFTTEELGIGAADVGTYLPGLAGLTVAIEPLLPPQVWPGDETPLRLGLGDVMIHAYHGEIAEENLFLSAAMTLQAGAALAIEDGTIRMTVETAVAATDLLVNASPYDEEPLVGLLDTMLPLAVPSLIAGFDGIPIPDISGFALAGPALLGDAAGGYLTVGATLERR